MRASLLVLVALAATPGCILDRSGTARTDGGGGPDAGPGFDAGFDAGSDGGPGLDAGFDGGFDAGTTPTLPIVDGLLVHFDAREVESGGSFEYAAVEPSGCVAALARARHHERRPGGERTCRASRSRSGALHRAATEPVL